MYIGREEELFFKDEALLFIEAIQYNNQDFCCTTSTAATRGTIAGWSSARVSWFSIRFVAVIFYGKGTANRTKKWWYSSFSCKSPPEAVQEPRDELSRRRTRTATTATSTSATGSNHKTTSTTKLERFHLHGYDYVLPLCHYGCHSYGYHGCRLYCHLCCVHLHFSSRMISSNASFEYIQRSTYWRTLRPSLKWRIANHVLVPCGGHCCVCADCSKRIKKKCPVGNCRVRSVLKIYSAGIPAE